MAKLAGLARVPILATIILQVCGGSGLPGDSDSATPTTTGKCEICPALQTFDDPQFRQNCPDQNRFQWIKDLIQKGCNQVWQLEAKTYYIDRQYLLPCGVQLKGAGSGANGTVIQAVRCENITRDYGIGSEGVKYRIGFVLNHNTSISDLKFQGADTGRYSKHGSVGKSYAKDGYPDIESNWCHEGGNGFSDLQGGGAFETPGCSDPYACSITPCINGKFTTPAGYKWDPPETIAIQNAVVDNIVSVNTNNAFFGAPLNEHLGFDVKRFRPSGITISNFVNEFSFADGLNFHGSFNDVMIDRFNTVTSHDDCIALWSYRDHMGAVTIQNSRAANCSYEGCYAVYGGSGPLTYKNNTCAATASTSWCHRNCMWLNEKFDGQFSPNVRLDVEGLECNGWPCNGSNKALCPNHLGTSLPVEYLV